MDSYDHQVRLPQPEIRIQFASQGTDSSAGPGGKVAQAEDEEEEEEHRQREGGLDRPVSARFGDLPTQLRLQELL
jgi:hypothetical protein